MPVDLSKTREVDGSPASERSLGESRLWRPHLGASLLCVAIYSAAVAIVWPIVNLATDDDFAYARMAEIFARTGHLVFNGWETAMVGWQVVWGGLFIHLFGYSYLTLRLSIIVLGALLTLLLHHVLLRSGVVGAAAVLGTLTVALSPLFIPMAASYMTDVPALLCIVLAVYGCQRALRAPSDRVALAWLCGSAALNVFDGTVRQIAWLGTLIIVPSAFWLLRHRKGFKAIGIVTWTGSVLAIVVLMIWLSHQPYVLPEHIIAGPINRSTLRHLVRVCFYGPLEVFCFSLPVLIAWISELRALSRRRRLQIVGFCAGIAPFLLLAAHHNKVQGRLPPWSANVVSRYGIMWSVPLMGDRPEIVPVTITSLVAVVLIASLAGFIIWLKRNARKDWFRKHEDPARRDELSLFETCGLLLPFSVAYFALLLPRAAFPSIFFDVWDRYFLPLIFVAVVLLLRLLKERQHEIPVSCYAVLLLFSFLSVAGTHDVFTAFRTIESIRTDLNSHGIPLSTISGPWQEDGANQIEAKGYINDSRLENPPGAYQLPPHPPLHQCLYWFGPLVPGLEFRYVLTVERLSCLVPSQYPDVTFTTWLPPFRRTIYVERNPSPH